MKTEFQILAALLRDFHGAIQHPKIARKVLFVSEIQDERLRFVFRSLLLSDGDWNQARRMIAARFRGGIQSPDWLEKLFAWAEKITARNVRALLPEKFGGES